MKFYEYREEIPQNRTAREKERLTFLWSFVNSGYKVAKVDIRPEYKTVYSAYVTLKTIATRDRIPIKLRVSNKDLFLVRCNEENETQD